MPFEVLDPEAAEKAGLQTSTIAVRRTGEDMCLICGGLWNCMDVTVPILKKCLAEFDLKPRPLKGEKKVNRRSCVVQLVDHSFPTASTAEKKRIAKGLIGKNNKQDLHGDAVELLGVINNLDVDTKSQFKDFAEKNLHLILRQALILAA